MEIKLKLKSYVKIIVMIKIKMTAVRHMMEMDLLGH
jgi:hypothetical protein